MEYPGGDWFAIFSAPPHRVRTPPHPRKLPRMSSTPPYARKEAEKLLFEAEQAMLDATRDYDRKRAALYRLLKSDEQQDPSSRYPMMDESVRNRP